MPKPKEYELKTIQEIEDVVTPENIDNFLVDFAKYLHTVVGIREFTKAISGKKKPIIVNKFIWIDDGKNDAHIHITNK